MWKKKNYWLNPRNFDNKVLTEKEILIQFNLYNAFWLHDGYSKKPHAELTSGMCSNGYVNCSKVLDKPFLVEILAQQLVRLLRKSGIKEVDWVIGSPYAGITFSYEVAKAFKAIHGFTEKDPSDPKKKRMIWKRFNIPAEAKVLQIEELITTSGTFQEVRRAILKGNSEPVNFLPVVGVLIHRPPKLLINYKIDSEKIKIISLVERLMWAVDPSECPLCKGSSIRYRPKNHWAELTGNK